MNRRTFLKQMTLLLAGGLVAACAPKGRAALDPTPFTGGGTKLATRSPLSGGLRLIILHTNDSSGYVDPCG
jgi:hypothetical protein